MYLNKVSLLYLGTKKFLFFIILYPRFYILNFIFFGVFMITFRFHRGTLEESLSTAVSFNSLFDLFNYLSHHEVFESFAPYSSNINQRIHCISLKYYSFDSRVCDHLFAVYINNHIIGFCY